MNLKKSLVSNTYRAFAFSCYIGLLLSLDR